MYKEEYFQFYMNERCWKIYIKSQQEMKNYYNENDNEHYTLENGGTEMTLVIRLSKGRMKCHLEHIKSEYGMIRNLIEYKNNKKTLSSINKQNFVNKLIESGILDPTQEQKEAIKKQKIPRSN